MWCLISRESSKAQGPEYVLSWWEGLRCRLLLPHAACPRQPPIVMVMSCAVETDTLLCLCLFFHYSSLLSCCGQWWLNSFGAGSLTRGRGFKSEHCKCVTGVLLSKDLNPLCTSGAVAWLTSWCVWREDFHFALSYM